MATSISIKGLDRNLSEKYPFKILLAEDNEVNQLLIEKMLSLIGFKIDIVENGLEVLEYLEVTKPDLIIMDIQMPKMDGLEATRKIIEKYNRNDRPKIVILTANSMIGDREKYLDIGADDYLSKPLRPTQVKKLIEYWGRRIFLREDAGNSVENFVSLKIGMLDFHTIDINRKLGDNFFSQVKKKFYGIYESSLVDIIKYSQEKNRESLFQASHKLKGACASIGAVGMRKLCMELEKAAKEEEFGQTDKIISELEKIYHLTKLKLDRL